MSAENRIDIKQLLYAINDKKQIAINFCMDEGCQFELSNKTQLIKIINYLLNYLKSISNLPLELGLELLSGKFQLTIVAIAPTVHSQINNTIVELLAKMNIGFDMSSIESKYMQIKLNFPLPDNE